MIAALTEVLRVRRTFLLYAVIGASGALLDLLVYFLLTGLTDLEPAVASFLSVSVGIVNNFALNARFNFRVADRLGRRLLSFYLTGLGGAVLSSLLIVLLFNVLGTGAGVAKLVTIAPVVLLQYFVNKRVSFAATPTGEPLDDVAADEPAAGEPSAAEPRRTEPTRTGRERLLAAAAHAPFLLLLNALFLTAALSFVQLLPTDGPFGGPDEPAHYLYNVGFILEQERLPVSGVDDLNAYMSCRENVGKVACQYSYVVYPGGNYVLAAGSAVVAEELLGIPPKVGARFASVAWGLVFLNLTYATAFLLTRRRWVSTVVTATVALIPQVTFITGYVNQDAHSLGLAALVCYGLARFLLRQDRTSAILAGVAVGGLLPWAKYNFFLLAPAVGVVLLVALARKQIAWRPVRQFAVASVVGFAVLGSAWFVRNTVLYGDPLGQSFVLEKMSEFAPGGPGLPLLSGATLQDFLDREFFDTLFETFWTSFGYLAYNLAPEDYLALERLCLLAAVVSVGVLPFVARRHRASAALAVVGIFAVGLGTLALVYYNSATYDFQPQGRYMFPVLSPLALGLAYLYRLDRRCRVLVLATALTTAFAVYRAVPLFTRSY